MKKSITLIIALLAIAGLSWWAISLSDKKGNSNRTELIDFAVENNDEIDKILITDNTGYTYEIIKVNEEWTDKDGNCISQESAHFILKAIKNIEFKGYLKDNSKKKMISLMSAQHVKVEIFTNGEWNKTWYIGPAAPDHYGQIMLLDSKKYGKSDLPVEMKIKGVNGIIEPYFFADPRKWMCTNIFSIPLGKLAKVDLKFNDEPERSFTVIKEGSKMDVYQQEKKLTNVDTNMIFTYLQNYKKIHFEIANYVLTPAQVDSVKNTVPFCELTVTETSKKATKLNCYRVVTKVNGDKIQDLAEIYDTNRDKLWVELPNGELVKCQYFVFNPLLLGDIYFPMDVSMLKTHDGILEKE